METIFVLLPLALLIAAIAVGFFIWAAKTGQFDDLETPAVRILFDDEEPRRPAPASASLTPAGALGEVSTRSQPSKTTVDSTRRVPE
jgi:cbb3-type cytochrome oxidase maturation protein